MGAASVINNVAQFYYRYSAGRRIKVQLDGKSLMRRICFSVSVCVGVGVCVRAHADSDSRKNVDEVWPKNTMLRQSFSCWALIKNT